MPSLTLPPSLTRTLTARLKPHRTEAIARIRFNALSLLVLLLLTSIVPGLPSLPSAIGVVVTRRSWLGSSSSQVNQKSGRVGWNGGSGGSGAVGNKARWNPALSPPTPQAHDDEAGFYSYLCLALSSLTAIFLFNVFESLYALKYPRTPPAPSSLGGKSPLGLQSPLGPAPKKRKLFEGVGGGGGGSPVASPQPQKPFSFSSSLSSSLSSSQPPSGYPLSPLSTPTRSLHYTPLSTPRSSLASSTSSSVMYTPSPTAPGLGVSGLGVSGLGGVGGGAPAYRGRAFGGSTARPLDGSYLGRIVKTEADSEDE